jgi:hypothetical protein
VGSGSEGRPNLSSKGSSVKSPKTYTFDETPTAIQLSCAITDRLGLGLRLGLIIVRLRVRIKVKVRFR